jgi:hypothetical protein
MKNKQDITVFVPERRRRSMLVTPGEAKRPGACGTRRAAPTCKVELLRSSERGGRRVATPPVALHWGVLKFVPRGQSVCLPPVAALHWGLFTFVPDRTEKPLHIIYFTLLKAVLLNKKNNF